MLERLLKWPERPIQRFGTRHVTDMCSNLLAYTHAQNFSLVGFQYFEFVAFQIDLVARLWNFTAKRGSVARQWW